jgi:hypothetical protein
VVSDMKGERANAHKGYYDLAAGWLSRMFEDEETKLISIDGSSTDAEQAETCACWHFDARASTSTKFSMTGDV